MADLIELFFGGFGVAIFPGLFFYMVVGGFRTVAECIDVTAS